MKYEDLSTGEFLTEYFKGANHGYAEIAYIAPEGVNLWPRVRTQFRELPAENIADRPAPIVNFNRQGYGAYFGTTISAVKHDPVERVSKKTGRPYLMYPRRRESDVIATTALWCDIDDVSPKEGRARLMKLPIWPTLIISSGGGVHGYWLLNRPLAIEPDNIHEVKRVLHGIAIAAGGGDVKVRDLARVMRLPGTANTKPSRGGVLCEVLDCFYGRTSYSQARDYFIRFAPREAPRPQREISFEITDKTLPRYVQTYLEHGAPEGERNHRLYAAARGYLDAGYSQMQAEQDLIPRAAADGLEHEEASKTVASAFRNTPSPNLSGDLSYRMGIADHLKGKTS